MFILGNMAILLLGQPLFLFSLNSLLAHSTTFQLCFHDDYALISLTFLQQLY